MLLIYSTPNPYSGQTHQQQETYTRVYCFFCNDYEFEVPRSSVVLVLVPEPERGLPSATPGRLREAAVVALLAGRVLILLSRGIIDAVFTRMQVNLRTRTCS